jgi:hypothetical protein
MLTDVSESLIVFSIRGRNATAIFMLVAVKS